MEATISMPTTEKTLASLIRNYADYNHWANCTLINWLKTKPREVLEIEVLSSFNSIRETLAHILQTQQFWLSCIQPGGEFEAAEFNGDLDEVFDALMAQSQTFAEYVESLPLTTLNGDKHLESPWFESNLPIFEYIMHCVNHSTYHRGQVVTIGRNLGFTDAPMTDYNFYNIVAK